jgi:hypothetical protein
VARLEQLQVVVLVVEVVAVAQDHLAQVVLVELAQQELMQQPAVPVVVEVRTKTAVQV